MRKTKKSQMIPLKDFWYKNVDYEDAKNIIREKMISSAENYVAIGYYLKHIWEKQQYREAGYSSIWECAKTEFGYSQGRASRYIDICEKYSVDGNSPYLDERFKAFNKSQLQELLSIKDEKLIEQVSPDMSVKEIRAMKNAAALEKDALLPRQMTIEGEFRELVTDNDNSLPKEQEPNDRKHLNVRTDKKEDVIKASVVEYGNKKDTIPEPKEPDFDNFYTEAEIIHELRDTDGNNTVAIKFSGCYGEFYGAELTEREINIFKTGVLSEWERAWERLSDILGEDTLQKIGYGELNREGE